MKRVIPFGTVAFIALLLCLILTVAQAQNEVYQLPQDSTAQAGDTAEVEIWVNATDFKSGQINLTYDSGCANVTNYVWNVTNFPLSGWSHEDGGEWITFMAYPPSLTGLYHIGTLTIQCVNADACGTQFIFAEPSMLFDWPLGHELPTNWIDGSFTCTNSDDIFDTGSGTYPSIRGMHNGTITPSCNITVSKLYTYPCAGTGGHSEYVRIWNSTDWNVTATWNGYVSDLHNISFDEPFTLLKDETYNYTIITGSYPQIIHKQNHTTLDDSLITCEEFIDANGNVHNGWIPAIRLFR